MNKNLYVGNLSQKVTEDDLKNNFSEAGAVASVSVIKDKFSGVSRGFGFVEMETEEGAQEAIKKFNGGDLDGKTITVNEARPARWQWRWRRRWPWQVLTESGIEVTRLHHDVRRKKRSSLRRTFLYFIRIPTPPAAHR
jgi:RNA recognition motif-containing protein